MKKYFFHIFFHLASLLLSHQKTNKKENLSPKARVVYFRVTIVAWKQTGQQFLAQTAQSIH